MEALKIVALALGASTLYGVLHDQVTARICVEYFTIGHPRVMESESPTLLALYWGVVATWWIGLPAGVLLALSARIGSEPWRTWRDLLRPLGVLLLVMASIATTAGVAGYLTAKAGGVRLLPSLGSRVPAHRHPLFIADLWAHLASYAAGALGCLIMTLRTAWTRYSSKGRA